MKGSELQDFTPTCILLSHAAGGRGLKVERSDRKRQEWRSDENSRNNLMQSIVNVLTEMWDQRHEIPLIACFRKEASTLHVQTQVKKYSRGASNQHHLL